MSSIEFATSASCPTLDQVCRRINDISTLPEIALRVVEIANDPNSTARDLKEVLAGDAALSTRVLRCINSSAYAMRSKVTNLQHAITYLGVSQIRNLAMTASVSELFKKQGAIGPYDRAGLWRHLVAVGIGARMIATRLGIKSFEDVFLAGLLHDIGIVLEDQHVHKQFSQVAQSLKAGENLIEVERNYLGFDHTILAGEMARKWRFPEVVIAAVRYHHNSANYRGDYSEALWCVEMANLICSVKGMSSVGVQLVRVSPAAISGLALKKEDIQVMAVDLDRELALNEHLFQL
jgi:putative nucleotidyltransferase with HDIG domain